VKPAVEQQPLVPMVQVVPPDAIYVFQSAQGIKFASHTCFRRHIWSAQLCLAADAHAYFQAGLQRRSAANSIPATSAVIVVRFWSNAAAVTPVTVTQETRRTERDGGGAYT
jgi:hypothetical protein